MVADVERVVPRENTHAIDSRTFGEVSPMHRRIFGYASGNIRGFIGAIHRLTVNDVVLESATIGDPSAMRQGCNGDVLTLSRRWYRAMWRAYERWRDFTLNHICLLCDCRMRSEVLEEEITVALLAYYWVKRRKRKRRRVWVKTWIQRRPPQGQYESVNWRTIEMIVSFMRMPPELFHDKIPR